MAGKKEITTLEEIGSLFGVTRMRVCQIEKKALKKIKNLLSVKYSI
jgi:DNA-directed RNA polymerase sigma subunit (sigma70/sigma32)